MPELPDITVYVESLRSRTVGDRLDGIRIANPFLLRTVEPTIASLCGRRVRSVDRLGKRIVFELDEQFFLVFHLMIAGRLRWKEKGAKIPGRLGLAALDFENGALLLTEAGSKRRAWLRIVAGKAGLRALDPGGLEVDGATIDDFRSSLTRENHTLKRALTDPRLFSGIGNAYSDEILHRARLSPVRLTSQLSDEESARLYRACNETLALWTDRLREEAGAEFPENVTAFREGMAVHGRYGKACPGCDSAVQRIVYADNETNYCPRCQTGGRLLADRGLSKLLKGDWPGTIEELEELRPNFAASLRRAKRMT